jgi:prevent-host-death family protein
MTTTKVKTVGASEAKTRFASLLRQAEKGREIVITKRGRPVARLVPPVLPKKCDRSVFDKLRVLRGSVVLAKGETLKDLINQGRRI